MENERHRHQIPCVVHQVDDCVGKCHRDQAVTYLKAIIKRTNRHAAHREHQIGMLFGEVAVVVQKTAITNYDGVGWRAKRRIAKKKNR